MVNQGPTVAGPHQSFHRFCTNRWTLPDEPVNVWVGPPVKAVVNGGFVSGRVIRLGKGGSWVGSGEWVMAWVEFRVGAPPRGMQGGSCMDNEGITPSACFRKTRRTLWRRAMHTTDCAHDIASSSSALVLYAKDVNSNSNGLSSTRVDITTKIRRPHPRSNIENNRVPSVSKSGCIKNKEVKNDKSEVVGAMCKQCLITSNHNVCVLNYVNDMNPRNANQSENVSNVANQKKHKPKVRKSKKLGSKERLASPTRSWYRLFTNG
ncbi:hypothetical protein Tco_0841074 [Tanacetum coccineum]|uniref:Uncharacterized protein n=1 Tax=Tanacetum coccineum TaxID=301880 RepID=A0ABQ5AYT9_9ASTR